ncbi:MAG: NADH-quinone oxidoreductase subunit M, partial [Planctomycetota bacterium]|nr:NADH-quinone oxidoreductase subunit M [Planctomycetota bacterium]
MLLTLLTFLPLAGAVPLLIVRDKNAREIKVWAFFWSFLTFLVSLPLWFNFDPTGDLFQFVETHRWIQVKGLTVGFNLGVDGISALLILLTTFLTPIALLGSWNYIKDRQKEFYIAMLALETAMIGVFAATDLFLFYVFFEASLIPMYLIIGIWGGENRIYATTKFVLYTVFGSLLMFVAILFVYAKAGSASFAIAQLTQNLASARASGHFTHAEEMWCFWAFALAFAIKVPLFPLHTWLPDAHVEAPTPGSVILAGILLKMGGYGFLRAIVPFFPNAATFYAPFFATICIVGIVYGSLMAFAQKDIKKLIAYSSVAHLGTCMLGIFSFQAIGVQGG